jgi:ribosomal protein S18 acetylase RimI-like enzyme
MNKPITITTPIATDIEGIQEVFYSSWLDTYPNTEAGITKEDIEERFRDRNSPDTLEKRRGTFTNPPEGHLILVAKDGEKITGVCRLIKRETVNQLQSIYILPEYQRRGIGHMFWEKALTFFDPTKETIVQVATYNSRAINFYKKLGFVDTGKRFTEERHRMPISGAFIPEMEMKLVR